MNQPKNILHGYSGGAFYLEAMANGAYIAHQHKPPSLYIGSSSGALIAVVSAIRGCEDMLKIAQNIKPSSAFKVLPFNKKGKITLRAIGRLICGKSPALQDARPILRKIITPKHYSSYLTSTLPPCYVLTADIEKGSRGLWNIKEDPKSYEEFVDIWEASSRMQGMTEPLNIRGSLHWDGGQFDHNPTHLLLQKYNIKEVVSLWSRPSIWTPKLKALKKEGYISKLVRMIELDNIEKSRNDEEREVDLCEDLGIKRYPIYTQRTLINHYDTDRGRLDMAIMSTIKSANKVFKNID